MHFRNCVTLSVVSVSVMAKTSSPRPQCGFVGLRIRIQRISLASVCPPPETLALLTRSECAYMVQFVELNHRNETNPWSVRQSLIYHRSQRHSESSKWLFVAATLLIRGQVNAYSELSPSPRDQDPFVLHLLIVNTVVASWRRYLIYLAEEVRKQVG